MTVLAWALFALAKVAASTQIDALHVVASEPALGDEIARAARRYLPRQTHIWSGAVPSPEVSEPYVELLVQGDPQAAQGLRWTIQVSLGPTAKLVRVLELREPPTRFDLAEAVAIELPELLTKLAEDRAAESAPAPVASKPAPVVSKPAPVVSKPAPVVSKPAPLRPALAKVEPPAQRPVPVGQLEVRQVEVRQVEVRQVADHQVPEAPRPVPVGPQAEAAAAPETQRQAAPKEDQRPTPQVAKSPPAEALTPPPPPPLPPLEPFQAPVPLRTQRPAGAMGLLIGGGSLLLAGVGTGSATLVIAERVSRPPDQKFDRPLDQTGKALGTATIVLDAVGATALLVGGIWMYAKNHRGKQPAPALTLAPALGPGQTGLVLGGRWP